MKTNDTLKKFQNKELSRLSKSVKKTLSNKLKKEYGKVPFEDYSRLQEMVTAIGASITVLKHFNIGEYLFRTDTNKNRLKFDIAEGSARGLITRFVYSKMMTKVLGDLGLNTKNLLKIINERVKAGLICLNDYKRSFSNINTYVESYEKAQKIYKKYIKEDDKDSNDINQKVLIYTLYDAFKEQEEFNMFLEEQESFIRKTFEIIIVDPIDIYIKITEDDFIIIFDSITMRIPFKKFDNSEAINIAMDMQKMLKDSYDDGFCKTLVDFLKDCMEEYIKSFKVYHTNIRNQINCLDERDKFLNSYENGQLFIARNEV